MAFAINGRMYDWASIELGIHGAPTPSFTAVEYSDEQEASYVHGKGRRPVGYRKGNYTASGKVTLHREAYEELMDWLGEKGISSLFDMKPTVISVSYANEERPIVTDVVEGVLWTARNTSMSQNDEASTVELSFACASITWNKRT